MTKDLSDHIRGALEGGSITDFESALDVAILAISHLQPVLGIGGLLFLTEANGDVSVTKILSRKGMKKVPFARVRRNGSLIKL